MSTPTNPSLDPPPNVIHFRRLKLLFGWPWSSKTNDLFLFLFLNVMIFWPALIAARSILVSQQFVTTVNASPWGYTFSLAMFWIPSLTFGVWTLTVVQDRAQKWAFWATTLPLIALGSLLDILLGRLFFTFPSRESVAAHYFRDRLQFGDWDLGAWLTIPAYKADGQNWFAGLFNGDNWQRYLPIEEFLFYGLGFITLLLIYIWGDAVVFPRHKVDERQHAWRAFRGFKESALIQFLVAGLLFAAAFLIQKKINTHPNAFPGYFLFLLLGALVPSLVLFHVSFHFVNWRSLTVAWLFLLTISQFWEGTLAVPYQWWGYQPEQMTGLRVRAQCDLPIEAVLVWSLASWTTVIVYEFILAVIKLDPPKSPTQRISWQGFVHKLRLAWLIIVSDESGRAAEQQMAPVHALKQRYHDEGKSKQSRAAISPDAGR
jgi:hypothetical protein